MDHEELKIRLKYLNYRKSDNTVYRYVEYQPVMIKFCKQKFWAVDEYYLYGKKEKVQLVAINFDATLKVKRSNGTTIT
eukprot:UN18181